MSTIKIKDYPNAIFYKTICDCTADDCTQTLIVEKDPDGDDMVTITIYNKQYLRAYDEVWYKNLIRRIRLSFQILFSGWFEVNGDLCLKGEDIEKYYTSIQQAYLSLKK